MTVATTDVSSELGQIKQELLDTRERARHLSEGLSDAHWTASPAPGQWSIGECLTHLNITTELFIPIIDDAIREGRKKISRRPRRRIAISKDGCFAGSWSHPTA